MNLQQSSEEIYQARLLLISSDLTQRKIWDSLTVEGPATLTGLRQRPTIKDVSRPKLAFIIQRWRKLRMVIILGRKIVPMSLAPNKADLRFDLPIAKFTYEFVLQFLIASKKPIQAASVAKTLKVGAHIISKIWAWAAKSLPYAFKVQRCSGGNYYSCVYGDSFCPPAPSLPRRSGPSICTAEPDVSVIALRQILDDCLAWVDVMDNRDKFFVHGCQKCWRSAPNLTYKQRLVLVKIWNFHAPKFWPHAFYQGDNKGMSGMGAVA